MEVGGQRLHAPSPPNSIKEISCRALGLALSPLLLHIHLSDMAFYWSLQTMALQFGTETPKLPQHSFSNPALS